MNIPIIALAYFALFIMGTIDNARGPIYPEILQNFNLTPAWGSWIFTLGSLVSFFVAISVDWWLKKLNEINVTKACLILAALSSFILGVFGKSPEVSSFKSIFK